MALSTTIETPNLSYEQPLGLYVLSLVLRGLLASWAIWLLSKIFLGYPPTPCISLLD